MPDCINFSLKDGLGQGCGAAVPTLLQSGGPVVRHQAGGSGFRGGVVFGSGDELADFGALLVEIGQVLGAKLLVELEFVLGAVFFAGADVGLAEPIVSVGEIAVEVEGALVVGDGLGVLGSIGIEIAELQLRIGERGVEFD
jgi:hypothetical protein